jgi:phosphoenolpyruvate---glycerone phosphotransferase subunit DhaL
MHTSDALLTRAFLGGIVAGGKAQPPEKTMVDAFTPAIRAAQEEQAMGASLADITAKAAAAPEEGIKATIPLLATKGRAGSLGERSVGPQDPGATSS